jgi:hypothetical protein
MPELARELLSAHALARGFMTATKGAPDEARSSRVLLKDLVTGKLLQLVPPPGHEADVAFADGAARGGAADATARKVPVQPTAARWLGQMKAEYEAQEGYGAHYNSTMSGRSKRGKAIVAQAQAAAATGASMQWRPSGAGAVPDRLVAGGRRVDL